MLIHGHRSEAGVGEQGKMISPGRKMADLLIKRGEKWAVNPFGQPPGCALKVRSVVGEEKEPALQEGRGEVTVIDDEKGDAVLPAEGHHLLGIGGIVSVEEVMEAGLNFYP